jgi:two-component system, OmpR family, sensor kinase
VFAPTLLEDLFCCQIEVLIANGGRMVEVFLTGNSFINGHVDQDSGELPGIKLGLGIVSEMTVVFEVETQHRGVFPA